MLPDMIHRSLLDADPEAVERAVERARSSGEGPALLLRGLHRFAGLCETGPGLPPATVVVDAVADLAPVVALEEGEDEVARLLLAACDYLLLHDASAPPEGWFSPGAPEDRPSFVPVSSLAEASASGDLDEIGRVLARLADAIMTREYLSELLIEVAAADPGGDLLVHAMAAVKGMERLDRDATVPVLYRLAEAVARAPVPPLPGGGEAPEALPWKACFRASLRDPGGGPERDWLYLTHAFQAARYVQLRGRGLRASLAARIADRFFTGDPEALRRAEAEPAAAGTSESDSAAAGDPDSRTRGIALSCIAPLRSGNPRPLLAVNAARWGAHLLGPSGAEEILEALRRRMPDLLRGPAGAEGGSV